MSLFEVSFFDNYYLAKTSCSLRKLAKFGQPPLIKDKIWVPHQKPPHPVMFSKWSLIYLSRPMTLNLYIPHPFYPSFVKRLPHMIEYFIYYQATCSILMVTLRLQWMDRLLNDLDYSSAVIALYCIATPIQEWALPTLYQEARSTAHRTWCVWLDCHAEGAWVWVLRWYSHCECGACSVTVSVGLITLLLQSLLSKYCAVTVTIV